MRRAAFAGRRFAVRSGDALRRASAFGRGRRDVDRGQFLTNSSLKGLRRVDQDDLVVGVGRDHHRGRIFVLRFQSGGDQTDLLARAGIDGDVGGLRRSLLRAAGVVAAENARSHLFFGNGEDGVSVFPARFDHPVFVRVVIRAGRGGGLGLFNGVGTNRFGHAELDSIARKLNVGVHSRDQLVGGRDNLRRRGDGEGALLVVGAPVDRSAVGRRDQRHKPLGQPARHRLGGVINTRVARVGIDAWAG